MKKLKNNLYRRMKLDELTEEEWYVVSWKYILSESIIIEFKDRWDWHHISCCQKLSEIFIRKFKNKLNWTYIWQQQELSENFIKEFITIFGDEKTNWSIISYRQKLSYEFMCEFVNKLNLNSLVFNSKIILTEEEWNSLRIIKKLIN